MCSGMRVCVLVECDGNEKIHYMPELIPVKPTFQHLNFSLSFWWVSLRALSAVNFNTSLNVTLFKYIWPLLKYLPFKVWLKPVEKWDYIFCLHVSGKGDAFFFCAIEDHWVCSGIPWEILCQLIESWSGNIIKNI